MLRAPAGLHLGPKEAQRTARHWQLQAAKPDTSRATWPYAANGIGRAWRGPGWESSETSSPLTQSPSTPTHSQTPALGPRRLPDAGAGQGWQCVGAGQLRQAAQLPALAARSLVAGPAAHVQHMSGEKCAWLSRPVGRSE